MSQPDPAFNIWLLQPEGKMLSGMRPVTSLDAMDPSGAAFHSDGLFSTDIFGDVGSELRDAQFSYVDLKTTILHPLIAITLGQVKGLYLGILSGKRYGKWVATEKDFVPASQQDGETGFAFFMEHFSDIVFQRNNSDLRSIRIDLLDKYRETGIIRNHLIMPAGLRDMETRPNGQTSEDEINDLYRKILSASNTIDSLETNRNSPALNTARWSIQTTAIAIYHMLSGIMYGKRGWMQQKYGSRKVVHGVRNVITSMSTAAFELGNPSAVSVTDTQIGLLQAIKSVTPISIYEIRNGIIGDVFGGGTTEAWLVNPKTLQPELVTLPNEVIDNFTAKSGIDKLMNRFFIRALRNKPLTVEGYYVALMYVDPVSKTFRLFRDINTVPENIDRSLITPATLADIIYISVYQRFKKLAGTTTRYPISGDGSVYPTLFKVRTTADAVPMLPLDDDWQPMGIEYQCPSFPIRTEEAKWLDSMVPHLTRIAGAGADFDGDMMSAIVAMTQQSYDEVAKYYSKRTAFVGANNKMITSTAVDTVVLVITNMTGDPIN